MKHRTAFCFKCLVLRGAPLQVFPQVPWFIGRGVAVQYMLAWWCQMGIEQGWHRQHHHVAIRCDAPLPISYPHVMHRQVLEILSPQGKMPMQKSMTGGSV